MRTLRQLACDHSPCTVTIQGETSSYTLRERAKRLGWNLQSNVKGKQHYCHLHYKIELRREEQAS